MQNFITLKEADKRKIIEAINQLSKWKKNDNLRYKMYGQKEFLISNNNTSMLGLFTIKYKIC